jgi:hypothetical protein
MTKVKMIKKDAKINIEIGTGFLQKLQKLMMYVVADLKEEDVKRYSEESKNYDVNVGFSEDWMEHLTTISVLIKEIEEKAETQGAVYEKDIDEAINEVNTEDSSPLPQSPEQPE